MDNGLPAAAGTVEKDQARVPLFRKRLFSRMLLLIGLSALLPLAAVIGISTLSAYRIVEEESFRFVEESGRRNAELISEELKGRLGKIETMATLMRQFPRFSPDSRRSILAEAVRSIAMDNPDILAVWTQWEPGALGDDPAKADPALSGPGGAFSAIWYYAEGKCVQGRLRDEDWRMDYYVKSKERRAPTLIDPYYYSYTGKPEDQVLETTIAVPIIVDGDFQGACRI